jgi:hypothetical protein
VLGKITERYLFLSVNRYDADWLTRPVVIALAVVIVAVLVYSIRQEMLGRAVGREPKAGETVPVGSRAADD